MIHFDHVSRRYPPDQHALSDVSFSVGAGEMLLIGGHSGAGKTTLLRLIAAIERPSGGTVRVHDQDTGTMKRKAIPWLRRNLGLVFQDQKLLFDRNAFENVMLPLAIAGFPPREAASRVRAALDKVGLLAREKAMPVSLSGGEQQGWPLPAPSSAARPFCWRMSRRRILIRKRRKMSPTSLASFTVWE